MLFEWFKYSSIEQEIMERYYSATPFIMSIFILSFLILACQTTFWKPCPGWYLLKTKVVAQRDWLLLKHMFRVGANVGLADSLIVTENQDDDWCLQQFARLHANNHGGHTQYTVAWDYFKSLWIDIACSINIPKGTLRLT